MSEEWPYRHRLGLARSIPEIPTVVRRLGIAVRKIRAMLSFMKGDKLHVAPVMSGWVQMVLDAKVPKTRAPLV